MKQLTAIFLILLFLFNFIGYRLFFYYVQEKSNAQYELSLDRNQYDESQLIAITVSLDMPYQVENTDYERVDGEVNVEGRIYKYVKRRVVNGQLELLCIPDHSKMKLQSAKDVFFALSNNITSEQNSKHSVPKAGIIKNITTDFDFCRQDFLSHTAVLPGNFNAPADQEFTSSGYLSRPTQPPDYILHPVG